MSRDCPKSNEHTASIWGMYFNAPCVRYYAHCINGFYFGVRETMSNVKLVRVALTVVEHRLREYGYEFIVIH